MRISTLLSSVAVLLAAGSGALCASIGPRAQEAPAPARSAEAAVPAETPAPAPRAAGTAAVTPMPVGMNLSPTGARNREVVFVDAMKSASMWEFATRPGKKGGRVAFGPDGWPEDVGARTIRGHTLSQMDGHYPAGIYVCTWSGKGKVGFRHAGRVTERGENRALVEVDPEKGQIVIDLTSTDADDPLRDVRLWMPGFEDAKSPFHPMFVERLRPFQVLRFGNWMRTWCNTGVWEERTTPASMTQSQRNGVSIEYMVQLCNELGSDPWFCMPHRADDEYVRRFAELVHETLRSDLRVYVEFSNEVWNGIFTQAKWARVEAKKRGLRSPEVTADESQRDWRIWREVFGDEADRIVRVAAGHLHNQGVARLMLERLEGEVDAVAITGYFGAKPHKHGLTTESTPEEIMEVVEGNIENVVFARMDEHRALVERWSEKVGRHISLVAYEGGPHVVALASLGTPRRVIALAPKAVYAFQEHPRMYAAYRRVLEGAAARGMELFMGYDLAGELAPADTFGHLQYLEQPLEEAPKYRALVEGWTRRDGSEPPPSGQDGEE